jgi:hypothetical protein
MLIGSLSKGRTKVVRKTFFRLVYIANREHLSVMIDTQKISGKKI